MFFKKAYSADLHLHSTYSDGSFTPQEIVKILKKKKIKAAAITDHDCVDGVREFLLEAEKVGIKGIAGIELSSSFERSDVHILGYGFDPTKLREIQNTLEPIQAVFRQRVNDVLSKYRELDIINVTPAQIARSIGARTRFLSLMHVAWFRCMSDGKISIGDAMAEIWRGGPCWVEYEDYPIIKPSEAVILIRDLGGIPVLAHPGEFFSRFSGSEAPSGEKLLKLIKELKSKGLGGIEAFHPSHSREFSYIMEDSARFDGLLVTGGSDFHGIFKSVSVGARGIRDHDFELFRKSLKYK